MDKDKIGYYSSPVGKIKVSFSKEGISSLIFIDKNPESIHVDPLPQDYRDQLEHYFNGKREVFDMNLNLTGTDFQKEIWEFLKTIPYGRTLSYSQVASDLNVPKSFRAVGNAVGKNPVLVIIPCHRVTGNNGKLMGYAGSLWRKQWLLEHEQKIKQLKLF